MFIEMNRDNRQETQKIVETMKMLDAGNIGDTPDKKKSLIEKLTDVALVPIQMRLTQTRTRCICVIFNVVL